jgi:hypothetical protein
VRNVGAVLELTSVRWGMPPTKVRRAAGHQYPERVVAAWRG